MLLALLIANREKLLEELRRRLEGCLPSEYYFMILFNPKGRQRTRKYFDAFFRALGGDLASFIKDQELIGYKRAVEGYPLEGVLGFTLSFKSVLWDFIGKHNRDALSEDQRISVDEVFYLHSILDQSYYSLSRSFIITRDEIINKRRKQLHELHVFAGEVVSIFDEQLLWEPVMRGVESLFGLRVQVILEPRDTYSLAPPETPRTLGSPLKNPLAKELVCLARDKNQALAATPSKSFVSFEDRASQDDYLCVCLPVPSHSRQGKVLLLLHDQGEPFTFERFDRNLLSQFVYFTGSVLVNCSMVSELAEKREYLSSLTSTLFTIQENERKRIAADIHDVLTQALSGIGFKLILCQELMDKQPQRLGEELTRLVHNVNEALRHSRHLVSNLRPTILDNLGIVAALNKTVNDFEESSGVDIEFSSPPHIDLPTGADISIFRILQESLHNIMKHANANQVRVDLTVRPDRKLEMLIDDDGDGFDPRRRVSGLGLMLMRERAVNLGGEMHLKSSPGNGTIIKIVLPVGGDRRNGPD
ncbi:MAG: sensor histidine kinase [Desulfarculaceae bacterium]|nr:sensor histidine kinase [Desulfarculaceae bacterium]MCF8048247.1 sensor histidine kinase [Desulfarculaceae bacterium]MCF8064288.1 sensor histidine kinase [Desulfarculaceae bacterium]MCF8096527.1 sensor histidine kinase [Desulfarculaceae bacterium]MCF8121781.1 sensor histidine kinase [Desulfarculaceae bacterium]